MACRPGGVGQVVQQRARAARGTAAIPWRAARQHAGERAEELPAVVCSAGRLRMQGAPSRRRCYLGRLVYSLGEWEGEGEGRAFPDCTLDAHLPTMGLDDRLTDVQPQAEPAARPTLHADAFGSVELLPDALVLARREPPPVVRDGDARPSSRHVQADGDRLVLRRVPERIGPVAGDRLPDAVGIGYDR